MMLKERNTFILHIFGELSFGKIAFRKIVVLPGISSTKIWIHHAKIRSEIHIISNNNNL